MNRNAYLALRRTLGAVLYEELRSRMDATDAPAWGTLPGSAAGGVLAAHMEAMVDRVLVAYLHEARPTEIGELQGYARLAKAERGEEPQ